MPCRCCRRLWILDLLSGGYCRRRRCSSRFWFSCLLSRRHRWRWRGKRSAHSPSVFGIANLVFDVLTVVIPFTECFRRIVRSDFGSHLIKLPRIVVSSISYWHPIVSIFDIRKALNPVASLVAIVCQNGTKSLSGILIAMLIVQIIRRIVSIVMASSIVAQFMGEGIISCSTSPVADTEHQVGTGTKIANATISFG